MLERETTATLLHRRRVVFVLNPVAGGGRAGTGLECVITSVCAEAGLDAVIQSTMAPGHATAIAVEAEAAAVAQAAGPAAVFVCGGDGSLNEVLNGVRRPETIVGQIPSGTANVWAKEAGIPNRAEAALRAQLSAPLVSIDLGRVTWPEGSRGRRFLLMASFGLDAVVVHAVNLRLKRRLGPLAYVLAGVRVGLRDRGFQAALRFDGASEEPFHGAMLTCGNTRLYGGLAAIAREASAVDGRLDYVGFRGRGPIQTAAIVPQVLLGSHLRSPRVLHRRAETLAIHAPAGRLLPPLQVDGEAVSMSAAGAKLDVEPGAVRMPVPRADRPLFQP